MLKSYLWYLSTLWDVRLKAHSHLMEIRSTTPSPQTVFPLPSTAPKLPPPPAHGGVRACVCACVCARVCVCICACGRGPARHGQTGSLLSAAGLQEERVVFLDFISVTDPLPPPAPPKSSGVSATIVTKLSACEYDFNLYAC